MQCCKYSVDQLFGTPPLYLFSTSRFLQKDFASLFYNQRPIEKWYHIIPRSPGHCLMSVWKKTSVTFPNKWSDFSSLEFWAEILAFDTHLRHKKYVFISVPWEHFWTLSMTITKPGDEQKFQKHFQIPILTKKALTFKSENIWFTWGSSGIHTLRCDFG